MATTTQATRRRKATKATTDTATDRTVRLNVAVSPEVWQRLVLHATMSGRTQAEILSELIVENLRSYRVQFIGPKESDRPDDSAPIAPPVESSAMAAV
jgi:hypothetical protein